MRERRDRVLWLTETAALLALLIALQTVTKPLGQLVTGACVNCVLAVAALVPGLLSALIIAGISPFAAFLMGIGPVFFPLTPVIALGNAVYVGLLSALFRGKGPQRAFAVTAASGAKFAVLYVLVVQVICRVAALAPRQVETFTAMFSWPQLVTALLGGAMAAMTVPLLRRALAGRRGAA